MNDWLEAVGFTWDRAAVQIPERHPGGRERALWRFAKSMAQFVWDSGKLEGNPFTLPEVQTLMEGITVGGRKVSDAQQIQGLIDASRQLHDVVADGAFALTEAISRELHARLAASEALDAGYFRGQGTVTDATPGVALGDGRTYTPPPTERGGANLVALHERAVEAIATLPEPFEQALVYNMFGSLAQLYFDGNKRTSRLMMNGHLMAHGYDAISVPASWRQAYNTAMVTLFASRDATPALQLHVAIATNTQPPVISSGPGFGRVVGTPLPPGLPPLTSTPTSRPDSNLGPQF